MTERIAYAWTDPRGVYGRPAMMLENVAFATCSSQPCICKNRAGFEGMPCLDRARRGIEAMREPTQDMLDEVCTDEPLDTIYKDANMRSVYTAMIDAALK